MHRSEIGRSRKLERTVIQLQRIIFPIAEDRGIGCNRPAILNQDGTFCDIDPASRIISASESEGGTIDRELSAIDIKFPGRSGVIVSGEFDILISTCSIGDYHFPLHSQFAVSILETGIVDMQLSGPGNQRFCFQVNIITGDRKRPFNIQHIRTSAVETAGPGSVIVLLCIPCNNSIFCNIDIGGIMFTFRISCKRIDCGVQGNGSFKIDFIPDQINTSGRRCCITDHGSIRKGGIVDRHSAIQRTDLEQDCAGNIHIAEVDQLVHIECDFVVFTGIISAINHQFTAIGNSHESSGGIRAIHILVFRSGKRRTEVKSGAVFNGHGPGTGQFGSLISTDVNAVSGQFTIGGPVQHGLVAVIESSQYCFTHHSGVVDRHRTAFTDSNPGKGEGTAVGDIQRAFDPVGGAGMQFGLIHIDFAIRRKLTEAQDL